MSRIERSILIRATPSALFEFHDDPRNLLRILPAYLRVEIASAPERLGPGARLDYTMFVGPLRFDWKLAITDYDPPHRFVDTQVEGPFSSYRHIHRFEPEEGGTRLASTIDYELPAGPLAELARRIVFDARVAEVLDYGHESLRRLFEET